MAWFKIDDGFWSHPKVITLPATAGWLWVRAGTYSMQHLTDGFIASPLLVMLGTVEDAETLVEAGLWLRVDGGYLFHDWEEYQPTKASIEADRAAAAERKRRQRDRGRDGRFTSREESHEESRSESRVTGGVTDGVSHTTPTRPDPTPSPKGDRGASKRGTRVPDSFEISAEMREWAKDNVPLVDIDHQLGEWLDYWRGVPGSKGVKLDWVSTWRNGMRKKQEFAERDQSKQPRQPDNSWMDRSYEL